MFAYLACGRVCLGSSGDTRLNSLADILRLSFTQGKELDREAQLHSVWNCFLSETGSFPGFASASWSSEPRRGAADVHRSPCHGAKPGGLRRARPVGHLDESLPARIIANDVLPGVAPGHDAVNRISILDSRAATHGSSGPKQPCPCKNKRINQPDPTEHPGRRTPAPDRCMARK